MNIMQPKINYEKHKWAVCWESFVHEQTVHERNKIVNYEDILKILCQTATVMKRSTCNVECTSLLFSALPDNIILWWPSTTTKQNECNTTKLVLCVVLWSFFIPGCPNKHPVCKCEILPANNLLQVFHFEFFTQIMLFGSVVFPLHKVSEFTLKFLVK